MAYFGKLYLDKEKDIIVELDRTDGCLRYVLRTPNHAKGNLIRNFARLCGLPLTTGDDGLRVIRGEVPCYVDERNREVYVLRLADTKVANIYPDGTIERKAYIPAISKTLMSQTKDYRLNVQKTLVKTYIRREYKFRTDLHTHMNANLDADILMALGIFHQIRYPLYYIKKLSLRCTERQWQALAAQRAEVAERFASSSLTGKYLTRKIDDNTFINFADLILGNLGNAACNLPKIRASLTILKDGQAVFTNLEKVYLYRYVFTKGVPFGSDIPIDHYRDIPDADIAAAVGQMIEDSRNPDYADNTLFQNKLLWIARGSQKRGVRYLEISDTTLVKPEGAAQMLRQVHAVMPAITRETGVTLRFLAAIRRIPLTIVREKATVREDVQRQLRVIRAVACSPYVAGSDIIGEEINDIRELRPVLRGLVAIAGENDGFVIRVHAGENDGLRDNVANSLACVREALAEGQAMPPMRIGHGLYTANLRSPRGRQLIADLRDCGVTLEFQLTSNVRLNNLSSLGSHPLKEYLRGGVSCVQGTDGGAIYGTDSIDEQLTMERLLELSYDEMLAMRRAEDRILARSMEVFAAKSERFAQLCDGSVEDFLNRRIAASDDDGENVRTAAARLESAVCLRQSIRELPDDKAPVILLGGSFNSSRHSTRMKPSLSALLRILTERLDPQKVFFVIGNRLSGYEKELVRLCGGRFEIFAIVPTLIRPTEAQRLLRSGVGVRVSIEPSRMGLYKSFAYEIFKRRPSVVLAFDGNSAGANTVQEAKNGKQEARIFVNRHCRVLNAKAQTIQGYVSVIEGEQDAAVILADTEKVWEKTRQGWRRE
ncbi:MAG: adenosine deaminase [Ruminococcus sp.]|nr:adenosine deaminase [Ruminococcus sp.]